MRTHSTCGFTLIELVLGLAIGLTAAVSLTGIFRSGLRVWKETADTAPRQQELRATLEGIARDVRNAIDVPGVGWTVDEEGIHFATLQEVRSPAGDPAVLPKIFKVRYQSNPQGYWTCMKQELSPAGRRTPVLIPLGTVPLVLEWDYAYASTQAPLQWNSQWTSRDLPVGVRVRLHRGDDASATDTYTKTIFLPAGGPLPWLR